MGSAVTRETGYNLILGPPGTGKTSTLLCNIEREMRQFRPNEIAFVTFTKSARLEARRRTARTFDCNPEDLEWFRTIHSTAFRLLGLKSTDLVSKDDLERFSKRYGYELSILRTFSEEEEGGELVIRAKDDALMATLDWARSRRLSWEDGARRGPFDVFRSDLLLFARRYRDFRAEIGRRDFHDLLELVLEGDLRPPVRVAFIDEAQDLSPCQVELVERWCEPCERVYVAGDDDQAIYTFLGGDPDWLMHLASRHEVQILQESFRVPGLAYDMAKRAISRNRKRVPKEYFPKSDPGELHLVDRRKAVDLIDESEETLVLGRNWRVIHSFAKLLRQRGVAFAVERFAHWSPLGTGSSPVFRAWRAVADLSKGRKVGARACEAIFNFIPSGKSGRGYLPRGAKKRAKDNKHQVDLDTLRAWGLADLAAAIAKDGVHVLIKVPDTLRNEIAEIQGRYGYLPKPKVTLTSMHASKGREAPTVIILPDMTSRTYKAYTTGTRDDVEAENRVAYVAITRTQSRLIICHPESPRCYPYDNLARRARVPGPDADGWQHGD